ncbi:hypothetical protein F4604DRAFT_1918599 [Suillus subluteus]|nr:hypothetical protein F4604DRAFT_1918599 [Suillus subluteus]
MAKASSVKSYSKYGSSAEGTRSQSATKTYKGKGKAGTRFKGQTVVYVPQPNWPTARYYKGYTKGKGKRRQKSGWKRPTKSKMLTRENIINAISIARKAPIFNEDPVSIGTREEANAGDSFFLPWCPTWRPQGVEEMYQSPACRITGVSDKLTVELSNCEWKIRMIGFAINKNHHADYTSLGGQHCSVTNGVVDRFVAPLKDGMVESWETLLWGDKASEQHIDHFDAPLSKEHVTIFHDKKIKHRSTPGSSFFDHKSYHEIKKHIFFNENGYANATHSYTEIKDYFILYIFKPANKTGRMNVESADAALYWREVPQNFL